MTSSYEITYSYSKYSCIREFYYVHLVFSYMMFIFGILCMVTRVLKPMFHPTFGILYIISFIWTLASSLLIHNTGLPLGVIVSFSFVLIGISMGWFSVVVHKRRVLANIHEIVPEDSETFSAAFEEAKRDASAVIGDEYFINYKYSHAAFMIVSWINIAGRIFSNDSYDFTCYTYPYYKNSNSVMVERDDPNYYGLPWNKIGLFWWGICLSMLPFSVVVGLLHYTGRRDCTGRRD